RRGAPGARVHAAGRGGRDLRGEDHRRRSRARLERAARRSPQSHSRAVAAPRSARRAARPSRHDLESTRRRRPARTARGAAGRETAHDVRRVPARTQVTARQAAYQVVLRVFEDDAYADRVLRTAAAGLDSRDRGLAQRLSYGTVQRVRTLDHAIGTLGKRPVRKLDPPVRAALRLGAYQLGYMEVAQHAAVNETVELVRSARLERAGAFTNAVMRRLEAGLSGPQSRGSQLAGLAVGARPGERTLDLCAAPGGKATQLEGDVVAVELHAGRARELEENCRRLGADNVTVVNADALDLAP